MQKPTLIQVKVIPQAKTNSIILSQDAAGKPLYQVKTVKPASDNQANLAVIKLLAEYFKVPKKHLKILRGLTSRHKIVAISTDPAN